MTDFHKWESNQLRVMIPPKAARDTLNEAVQVPDDPFLAAILPQATGVRFEMWGLVSTTEMFGNPATDFQTHSASITVAEARELAHWILEHIDQ